MFAMTMFESLTKWISDHSHFDSQGSQLFLSVCLPLLLIVSMIYAFGEVHLALDPRKNVVIVTGCDSGFGLGTAKRLAGRGFLVIATCMTEEGLQRLQSITAAALICDVTKDADVEALVALTHRFLKENRGTRLWTLVNNAGIAPMGCVDWMPLEVFRRCMEVNYFAPIRLIKEFLPLLKRTRGSRVINLSSVAGQCGAPFLGPYGGSKHALEGVGKALREELLAFDIYVCHVNPGVMNTNLISNAWELSKRYFSAAPAEITGQYEWKKMEDTLSIAQFLKEDPALVVDAVTGNVTLATPPFWTYPGIQAKFLQYFQILPRSIQENIQMTTNPPPRPVHRKDH